jgi:hypothetical protein
MRPCRLQEAATSTCRGQIRVSGVRRLSRLDGCTQLPVPPFHIGIAKIKVGLEIVKPDLINNLW